METYSNSIKTELTFEDLNFARLLFGEHNSNLNRIADTMEINIHARGNTVYIDGDTISCDLAENLLNQLYELLQNNYPIYPNDIDYAIRALSADDNINLKDIFLDSVFKTAKNRSIAPKNPAQKEYIDAVRTSDIVFGIGPAGTGKTYLAMAMAVSHLSKGIVNRIILTRPAVEAGESLGFLPGDLSEKVDPYLRPLYDALHDMMPFEKVASLMEQGVIEVAPLAFMRGRTLNDAFIILDEAQNTTAEQMKMFLTRIGFGSRAVITGDITQTDLPRGVLSGLRHGLEVLDGVEGIGITRFDNRDVVRHPLVQRIVDAYDRHDEQEEQAREASRQERQQATTS
jgi:phosphate starvation-inducible PhoH-like protein